MLLHMNLIISIIFKLKLIMCNSHLLFFCEIEIEGKQIHSVHMDIHGKLYKQPLGGLLSLVVRV